MKIIAQLTDRQYEAAMVMLEEHAKTCEWASGMCYGGVIYWEVVHTSIGQLINLKCHCEWRYLANGNDL